ATTVPSRRSRNASASDSSAAPYIGEVSNTRVPASSAASTTARAIARSPPKVLHVPSPTTGPSRRSSTRDQPRGERSLEERGIVVRPAAHVGEWQTGTGLAPAARVDLLARRQPHGRLAPGRPGHHDLAEAERERGARVVGDAEVALARIGLGDARAEDRPAA